MYTTDEMQHCLVQLAKEDCQQAYHQLFRWFYKPLQQFAYAFVRSKESAEEIAADVLMTAWKQRQQLPQIANIKVYLYVIAKNASLNYLRRQDHNPTLSLDDISFDMMPLDRNPEQLYITAEMVQKVEQAVRQLPPRCCLIFKLIREDGLKYKEVAAILGISVNTINAQMTIAFKKISQAINFDLTTKMMVP